MTKYFDDKRRSILFLNMFIESRETTQENEEIKFFHQVSEREGYINNHLVDMENVSTIRDPSHFLLCCFFVCYIPYGEKIYRIRGES